MIGRAGLPCPPTSVEGPDRLPQCGQVEYGAEGKPTLFGLHLVRGLCAITVMAYHYLHEAGVGTFHSAGTYGVYIFFVLSGYALTYVYADAGLDRKRLGQYFIARAFRILPLYFLVATYQLYMLRATPGIWEKYILNITMIFGLATPGATSIVPGGWSIGIEAVFYLLFPVILIIHSLRTLVALFIFTVFINHFIVAASYNVPSLSSSHWAFYTQTPTFLVYFIGGMLLAKLRPIALRGLHKHHGVAPLLLPALAALMIGVFFVPSLLGISRETLLAGFPAKIMIAASLLVIALGSLVVLKGHLASLASYLGDISYALYLWHYPVWNRVRLHIDASIEIQAIVSVALSFSLATLTYYAFERRTKGLRRLFKSP